MEAIILAGGFGTRLRHLVPDLPKPMASVAGRPFLEYIFQWLLKNNVTKVILATGYLNEKISEYFGFEFEGLQIAYSVEDTPLLTGGAIKKALSLTKDEKVFVINGDTYFNVDLKEMGKSNHQITIAVKELGNFSRYGTLTLQNNYILEFNEKKPCKHGYINGGIYLINRKLLNNMPDKFSFEIDFLEKKATDLNILAFYSNGSFIDIGVPNDYLRAQEMFKDGAPY